MIPKKYYNRTARAWMIKDLNVKAMPNTIVDISRHKRITQDALQRSYLQGDLADLLLEGKLEIIDAPDVKNPVLPLYTASLKPIPSRIYCTISKNKADDSSFVDEIQNEWLSNPMAQTEAENARTAEKLMNSDELEDFDDVPFQDK